MATFRMLAALLCLLVACTSYNSKVLASPVPDSAGIVEMIPGIAYGGIPYGSISGMLRNYAPGQAYYPAPAAYHHGVHSSAGSPVLVAAAPGLPLNSVGY